VSVQELIQELNRLILDGFISEDSQIRLDVYSRGGVYVIPLMPKLIYVDAASNLHIDAVDI
jgi:hypothetical protein